MASNNYINECKNGANGNRLGKITVDGEQTVLNHTNHLSSFTIDDGCYVDGNIIGTVCSKKIEIQLVDTTSELDLLDKKINAYAGVKYANNTEEWINMGKYTVEHPKDEQTADMTQITAYDEIDLLKKPYVCTLDFENDDVYIADFYEDVCTQLGLTPKTLTFLNSDLQITANPFVNRETLGFVLQEIEKVSCSFCEIDPDTNKIDLVWLSDSEEPDYEFNTGDYSKLEGGKIVYGPINTLVLKYSQIDGENATMEDQESIAEYGVKELDIEDSYFLYTEELKWEAIEGIWDRVKGLTYTDCKITTYYGKPFLKIGSKIRINTNDNRVIDTYVLKHKFTYDGTFTSEIESPALTDQETKTKNTSVSQAIKQTEIRVDKAEGNIKATTTLVREVQDSLENYYTINQTNEVVQTAETGITNTFSEAGGNNIFRNTGLWFKGEGVIDEIESGETINTILSNPTPVKSIKINGKTEQQTYNGKNLFNIYLWDDVTGSYESGSVTLSDETLILQNPQGVDFYTHSGMTTTGNTIPVAQRKYLIEVEPNTDYTISFIKTSNDFNTSNADSSYYSFEDENYVVTEFAILGDAGFNNRHSITITTASNTKYLSIRFGVRPSAGTITYSKIQIEKSSTMTDYEEYVGGRTSPNPDYPQKVSIGKSSNLFETTLVNNGTTITKNHCTVTLNDDEFTLTATDDDAYFGEIVALGNSYVNGRGVLMDISDYSKISMRLTNNEFNKNFITFYDQNKISLGYNYISKNFAKIDKPFNAKYMSLRFGVAHPTVDESYSTKAFLGGDTINCRYTPYNKLEIFNVKNNLYNVKDSVLKTSGVTLEDNDYITISYDNTSGSERVYENYYTDNLFLKENTEYTIVLDVQNVSGNGEIWVVSRHGTLDEGQFQTTKNYSFNELQSGEQFIFKATTKVNLFNTICGLRTFCFFEPGESGSITFRISVLNETPENFTYSPYTENIVQYQLTDNYLAEGDYIINDTLYRNTRHLQLKVSDMNNSEEYPGWSQLPYLHDDYPNDTRMLKNITKYWCNICGGDTLGVGINTTNNWSTLYLSRAYFGEEFTQTYWKTNYPDLVVDIYYELADIETETVQPTGNLELVQGENNILNNMNVEMEITYELTNEYEFWSGGVLRGSNFDAVCGNSMMLQKGTLSQQQDVPNGNYSVSFYYKKNSPLATVKVKINDIEYDLDSEEYKLFYTGEQDTETSEYITYPIEVTNNYLKIEFTCNVPNGAEIYDLMANKGTVKLAWSQNQNETTTDTVNISKGITITSTNSEAIFRANADGITILTLQKETVAYFTDKGLSTKELVVENQGQICDVLIQEVGDQTWFTRM